MTILITYDIGVNMILKSEYHFDLISNIIPIWIFISLSTISLVFYDVFIISGAPA